MTRTRVDLECNQEVLKYAQEVQQKGRTVCWIISGTSTKQPVNELQVAAKGGKQNKSLTDWTLLLGSQTLISEQLEAKSSDHKQLFYQFEILVGSHQAGSHICDKAENYQNFCQLSKIVSLEKEEGESIELFNLTQSIINTNNNNNNIDQNQTNGIIADFSIIRNYKELISLPTQDPNLAIFSGIRTFAFLMVIYGHTNQMIASSTYQLEIARIMENWQFIWLADMLYSVDIFFWLGGFFLGFILCDTKKSSQISTNPMGVFSIILHRLLRIWPSYIVAMMINSYLAPFMGSGPRWFAALPSFECQGGAWKNLLFIDNWFEDFKLCFGWGWYLTNDFQLFLVSLIPIVLYSLNYKKSSKLLIIILIIGTLIVGLVISIKYSYYIPIKALFVLSCYYNYYVKPYCRAPPYLLGLLLGILYREHKTAQTFKVGRSYLSQFSDFIKIRSQRYLFQFGMYLLGFTIIGWLLLGWRPVQLNPDDWSELFQEIYHAFCRTFFVFGVTLLALVNMVGIKDFFNTTFMNCIVFRFMAKISFTCYLVHLIIICITNATFYQAPEFTYLSNFYTFFGNLGLTIIAAVLLTLLVEIPFGKLETRLMKKLTMQKKQNTLLK